MSIPRIFQHVYEETVRIIIGGGEIRQANFKDALGTKHLVPEENG